MSLSQSHFIRKDRVALIRAMYAVSDKWHFNCFRTIVEEIRLNSKNDWLSISQENKSYISYARTPSDKYDNSKRVRTSLGKYIRRNFYDLFNDDVNDSSLDKFVCEVMGIVCAESISVNFIHGNAIIDFYGKTNATSCMSGNNCHIVKLYADNSQKVCLLSFDEVRALLWTCDDGTKVLDRAYPSGHHKINILREWAAKQGYIYRENPDKMICGNVNLSDGSTRKVTLHDSGIYPYMDTFAFGKRTGDDKIILSNDEDFGDLELRQTDGSDGTGSYCSACNCHGADYSLNDELYCEDCYDERHVMCNSCDNSYDNVCDSMFEDPSGMTICENCYEKLCVTCARCGSVEWQESASFDVNNNPYCEYCTEKYLQLCDCCHELFRTSLKPMVECEGKMYCESCTNNELTMCENCDEYHLKDDECTNNQVQETPVLQTVVTEVSENTSTV